MAIYTAGFCTYMSNYLKFRKNQLYRRDAPYLTYEPKYEFIGHRIGGQKSPFSYLNAYELARSKLLWYFTQYAKYL